MDRATLTDADKQALAIGKRAFAGISDKQALALGRYATGREYKGPAEQTGAPETPCPADYEATHSSEKVEPKVLVRESGTTGIGDESRVARPVSRGEVNGRPVTTLEYAGQAAWLASEIGTAFGYKKPRQVQDNVTSAWSHELVDGVDYAILRGEDLAALKAAMPDLVHANTPSLMLLTETGVALVASLSRRPAAREVRRHIIDQAKKRAEPRIIEVPAPLSRADHLALHLGRYAVSDDLAKWQHAGKHFEMTRRVARALLCLGGNASTKAIAKRARMSIGNACGTLNRMEGEGFVTYAGDDMARFGGAWALTAEANEQRALPGA
jgi:hypothetical protein